MPSSWHTPTSRPKATLHDYSRKRYGANPLFPSPGSRRGGGKRGVAIPKGTIALAAILLAAGGVIGVGVWGSPLRLQEVTVAGATPHTEKRLKELIEEQAGKKRLLLLPQTNVALFDVKGGLKRIGQQYSFASIELRKKLPHGIELTVAEKTPTAALITSGRLLALDADGSVIRDLNPDEVDRLPYLPPDLQSVLVGRVGAETFDVPVAPSAAGAKKAAAPPPKPANLYPVIAAPNLTETASAPGKPVVSRESLSTVLDAHKGLQAAAGSQPHWFSVDDAAQSIDVTMDGGWHVFITPTIPFATQAERLSLVLKEKVGDRKADLTYIDLRYNERIFFKFKE